MKNWRYKKDFGDFYYEDPTQKIFLKRHSHGHIERLPDTHFRRYSETFQLSESALLDLLTRYFTQHSIKDIIPLMGGILLKSKIELPLKVENNRVVDGCSAILYDSDEGRIAHVVFKGEDEFVIPNISKLEKLPEKYCIRNEGYHETSHPLHKVWERYIKKYHPNAICNSRGTYYTNEINWAINKPEGYTEISLEDWNRLSNLVVIAENISRSTLTELPKQYAIQYRPGSFSEKEKILWKEYVDFINLGASLKIQGDVSDIFYYNDGDTRRLCDLNSDCAIITLDVWDRLRPKKPTVKQVLNIASELSAEEFLSLPEQNRLTHLEWKYPPGTRCVSKDNKEFFTTSNPVRGYVGLNDLYGKDGDYDYLFIKNKFTEILFKPHIQESNPTKKDLSSIKTKEEAYDYLISIGVRPGMEYTNTSSNNRFKIPENFLNKKEILSNTTSYNLDPGWEKGYYLWKHNEGFLIDFDDIDMYGNTKTQKVNGKKPVIHVMEEASIDKSLIPEMEIKAKPLTKNEAFGLRYGTATFDKLEKVGSKEEIGIKKFNVPKI